MLAFATPLALNSRAPTISRAVSIHTRWAAATVTKRHAASINMAAAPPTEFANGIHLLVKQGPNEGQLGDCPFSQKANMALRARGVDFSVHLISFASKPQWFKSVNEGESTPTYIEGDHYITSSDDIVVQADKVGTKGTSLYDKNEHWEKAEEVIGKLFSAFAAFMKNKDPEKEKECKDELNKRVDDINLHLKHVPGRFVVSDNLSALDCNLAPKLHAVLVAGKHFKDYELPWHCQIIPQYMRDIYDTQEWKDTACSDDVVIWGWSKFFK